MQTSLAEECVRFPCPSGGQKSRQNVPPGRECLRGARAMVAALPETHSDGSRDRCEIRPVSPFPPDHGWLQPLAGRPPGEFLRYPNARTLVPEGHGAVWAAMREEYRR